MSESPAAVDPIRSFLRQKLDEAGITMQAASLHIGRNSAYLHQFIHRRSPKTLHEDDREQLARLLGIPADLLRPGSRLEQEESAPLPRGGRSGTVRDVPMFKCGSVGGMPVLCEKPERFALRPEALHGVPLGYCCRLADNVFAPAWRHGDLLYFDPSDVPLPGDMVCAELDGARRLIGLFDGHALNGRVRLRDLAGKHHAVAARRLAREVVVIRR